MRQELFLFSFCDSGVFQDRWAVVPNGSTSSVTQFIYSVQTGWSESWIKDEPDVAMSCRLSPQYVRYWLMLPVEGSGSIIG